MVNENGKRIFLSYSSKSKQQTSTLAENLKSVGHEVWFDENLSGGQIWWDEICKNIRECEIFIFVLDRNSQLSDACEVEWQYALKLDAKILPVGIAGDVSEKILPEELANCQIFHYSERDVESFLDLKEQINNFPLRGELPDPLPPQPPAPMSYLNVLAEKVGTYDRLGKSDQDDLVQSLEQLIREDNDAEEALTLLDKLSKRGNIHSEVLKPDDVKDSAATQPNVNPKDWLKFLFWSFLAGVFWWILISSLNSEYSIGWVNWGIGFLAVWCSIHSLLFGFVLFGSWQLSN